MYLTRIYRDKFVEVYNKLQNPTEYLLYKFII